MKQIDGNRLFIGQRAMVTRSLAPYLDMVVRYGVQYQMQIINITCQVDKCM